MGPGLLESVYKSLLGYELDQLGLQVQYEVPVPVIYGGRKHKIGFRLDLLIENKVVVEVKSVENLAEVHHKQVLTYLKISGHKLGILVNFNTDRISNSIFRKVNGL